MRASKASKESVVHAAMIQRNAERRLGELLTELPKAEGTRGAGRPSLGGSRSLPPKGDAPPKLADLGVSKIESSRFQALAGKAAG